MSIKTSTLILAVALTRLRQNNDCESPRTAVVEKLKKVGF
jgi:hypothetical protein